MLVLRVISTICLGRRSVSLQFFRLCSFYVELHPHYKAIIDLFASKQKDISVTSIDYIVSDAQFMDELSFFGSNGRCKALGCTGLWGGLG